MFTRRQTVTGILAAATAAVAPAIAETGPTLRLGALSGVAPMGPDTPLGKILIGALADRGYTIGRNLSFYARGAMAHMEKLPSLIAELKAQGAQIFVTAGYPTTAATKAAGLATVAYTGAGDPVATGLIESWTHPGGLVTGISDIAATLTVKRLEFLKALSPNLKRVAILWNADDRAMTLRYEASAATAQLQGLIIQGLGVREPDDFNGAFEATPNGLAYFDASDRLVFCNEAYQRGQAALGIKSEIGLTYADILSRAVQAGAILAPAGEEAEWMAGLLRARREASSVREQQAPDGRVFQISNNHTPDGGIVSSYTDITELRQQAQDLTVARDAAQAADRAKSVFLANMSHELRTPMNGVMGVAGLLAHEPLTMRQAELVSIIQASGSVLDRLLADLLDMSSLEAGAIKIESAPFQLGATVNQVCALLAPQSEDKGLPLRVEIDAGADLRFLGDEARVKQILTNLVSNAIKFTDRGEVLVSAAASAGEVTLSVIDTGIGFDPADKARLFARFEQADGSSTRRYGGSGLGLSVSQDLALHMGGRVTAENRPEGGSVFALTLPLPLAPDVETSGQADEVEAPEGGARALVVDDNSTNQRVLSLILKGAGIDCVLADDGSQAVELWRSEGFDLVFMDIQMPVMDGVTAVRTIRALEAETGRPKTPIIMVSANAQPDDVHESHAAGADAHVAKPVSAGHLFEVINRVVNDIGEQDQVAA